MTPRFHSWNEVLFPKLVLQSVKTTLEIEIPKWAMATVLCSRFISSREVFYWHSYRCCVSVSFGLKRQHRKYLMRKLGRLRGKGNFLFPYLEKEEWKGYALGSTFANFQSPFFFWNRKLDLLRANEMCML